MGQNSLNDGESQLVHSSAGGQVKSAAVARLYTSQGSSWSYTNIWGAATLVASHDSDVLFIRLVDLQTGSVAWEQELYERFEYQAAAPFFHTFEGNDAVIGLSFADESDAAAFHSAVCSSVAGGAPARPAGGPPPVPGGRRTAGPAPGAPPQATRSPPATPPGPSTPTPAPVSTPPPALQRAPSSAANINAFSGTTSTGGGSKRMENPKKKKGWFSRITEKMGLAEDDGGGDVVLSGPTGFRHESHIGWDPANGFEIRNIPPEWRKLFQAAGVKKSELRDANTAKFIMDTVAEATVGLNPMAAPAGGPPPPVPGHHGGPPPPPGAPAPPAPYAPPPAPMAPPPPSAPMAPPPPTFNAPGAPPPPPPAASGGFGGSSLAAQLSSAQLKSVEDRALPSLSNLNEEQSHNLADTLARAMAARRVDMRADDDELDSDDEWSD